MLGSCVRTLTSHFQLYSSRALAAPLSLSSKVICFGFSDLVLLVFLDLDSLGNTPGVLMCECYGSILSRLEDYEGIGCSCWIIAKGRGFVFIR